MIENLGDVFALYETKAVGEYERQLTSTLFFCKMTELTTGLCECFVNHTMTRGDQVRRTVWSAHVLLTTTPSPGRIIINAPQCALVTACIDLLTGRESSLRIKKKKELLVLKAINY